MVCTSTLSAGQIERLGSDPAQQVGRLIAEPDVCAITIHAHGAVHRLHARVGEKGGAVFGADVLSAVECRVDIAEILVTGKVSFRHGRRIAFRDPRR